MSIQTEIDRINMGVTAAYNVLEGMGATMPEEQNVDNLAATISSICADSVRYSEQSLTDEQKAQARENIGCGIIQDNAVKEVVSESGELVTITDAIDADIVKIEALDGKAFDKIRVFGKNHFYNDNDTDVTNAGLTAHWDADTQEFIINGTVTGAVSLYLNGALTLDWTIGDTYTMTVEHTGGTAQLPSGKQFAWSLFTNNLSAYERVFWNNVNLPEYYTVSFNAFESAENYILMMQNWADGMVFDNYRVRIQIEAGSSFTQWEAYRDSGLKTTQGYNNIAVTPKAGFRVVYRAEETTGIDTKTYVDNKFSDISQVALQHTVQPLTEDQKLQVRTNIDAQQTMAIENLSSQIVLNYPENTTVQVGDVTRYGKICIFTFQFIVHTAITDQPDGFEIAKLPVTPVGRVWVNNQNKFYMDRGTGIRVTSTALAAGGYLTTGVFIIDE